MKNILVLVTICLFSLTACHKSEPCVNEDATCNEQPPTGIVCQAYFVNWFYNPSSNSCEEIGYSACSPVGFAAKEDCEALCLRFKTIKP